MAGIRQYYEKTKNQDANEFVVKCMSLVKKHEGYALDLGSGTGSDTVFLLNKGYYVYAVDCEPLAEDYILERISGFEKLKGKFSFINERMETIKLDGATFDVIVAYNSLGFCDRDKFVEMWGHLVEALKEGGYFIGNFWGKEHYFSSLMDGKSKLFLDAEEIYQLFEENFKIIVFEDCPVDKKITMQGVVDWKECLIFAQKVH